MKKVMMKCGHTAQGTDGDGNPVCVICFGIDPGATIPAENEPYLSGRYARCAYYGKEFRRYVRFGNECRVCADRNDNTCRCERESSISLAFFEHKPEYKYDKFYCGCHSWS